MFRFDGKHWLGRRTLEGPLQIHSYEHVVDVARIKLGSGGVVAVPNARGPDHKLGAEYRYEEFVELAGENVVALSVGGEDKRAVADKKGRGVCFIKAQEINTPYRGENLVFLAYNLPWKVNLNEKDAETSLRQASELGCILGITGTSCLDVLEEIIARRDLLGCFDFVVTHASTAGKKVSEGCERLYGEEIYKREFVNPFTNETHRIGAIAVSGGHRTPTGLMSLLSGESIGSSYTNIYTRGEYKGDDFLKALRYNLREATPHNMYKGEVSVIEKAGHGLAMVLDRLRGHR